MNVLLVDDQKAVVDSLKNGIHWDRLPVGKVYTACSAKEAKMVLKNFPVDVLISDIEMPEEDGISLCNWAKQEIEDIECIFLTSHADFEYAREAIRMRSFDYILQPARYEDVERVLVRAWDRLCEKKKMQKMIDNQKMVLAQKNHILDALVAQITAGNWTEAEQIHEHLMKICETESEGDVVYPMLIQVLRWKKITNIWDKKLVSLVLKNVLDEIFAQVEGKTVISNYEEDCHWIFLIVKGSKMNRELWRRELEAFYAFIDGNMDFSIAVYPMETPYRENFRQTYETLLRMAKCNQEKKKGVFWEAPAEPQDSSQEDPVGQAISYIKRNLNKNISRTDVANYVHLNEEYFSRLFKQQTGDTFKEYVLMMKMKEAEKLLENSRLSISIIASKVGYDNFSHFSKMFKKVTNQTPQEYRKAHEK